VARHVREIEVEKDDIVVVELTEIDAFFAELREADIETLGFQHQLDAPSGRVVILDQ